MRSCDFDTPRASAISLPSMEATHGQIAEGSAGNYVLRPAEEDNLLSSYSGWTPINRSVTCLTPSQSQSIAHNAQQTLTPAVPVTPPASSSRVSGRGRKRNLDASPINHDQVAKKKPAKRSSTDKKRPKKSAATNRTVDYAHAVEPARSADQYSVPPKIQPDALLDAEPNMTPRLRCNALATPNATAKAGKQARQPSMAGRTDHATHLDREDSKSDTIDYCAEYDEIFSSLLDDAAHSTAVFSNFQASLHDMQHWSSLSSNEPANAKLQESNLKSTSEVTASSAAVAFDCLVEATNVQGQAAMLHKFKSPVTPKPQQLMDTTASPEPDRKPIVRSPFPSPVLNRSPVVGLSPGLLLRTCFRIGEAINQACHAAKNKQKVVFELYARIVSSQRDNDKQEFVFCDLFHEKLPHLRGTYSAAIWKHVDLYEYDSRRLLTEKRMCRCMGEIKRDGKEWVMIVFNIWQATWEDVEWVEGIVNA
ncbi:unnamed protein product [Periconia digitata]|uniref:Uncharacterized protein n=1 Tax=Periconia digitata TaxID=1303443 RepID=A0A9W4UBA7_9PLEO|nr:unnamed protein product [Periconia digitata]